MYQQLKAKQLVHLMGSHPQGGDVTPGRGTGPALGRSWPRARSSARWASARAPGCGPAAADSGKDNDARYNSLCNQMQCIHTAMLCVFVAPQSLKNIQGLSVFICKD